MRRIVAIGLLVVGVVARGAEAPAGRWQGRVDIPGRPLVLVVDLAPGVSGGWTGSVILPALGIKGAPLFNVSVDEGAISFDMGGLLATAGYAPAAFRGRLGADGAIVGQMRQAGNVAPFTLTRTGPAQVEASPQSTPVTSELARTWRGEFELGGYPRRVTLTFENRAGAGASAVLVVVGKATTNVPIDLVVQEGASVRIESQAMDIAFEGRLDGASGELQGTIEIGSVERPLVLQAGRSP